MYLGNVCETEADDYNLWKSTGMFETPYTAVARIGSDRGNCAKSETENSQLFADCLQCALTE